MPLAIFGRFFGIGAVPGSQGRASDSSRSYLPQLTGLRGIAIMMVVCGHLLERIERFYAGNTSLTDGAKDVFTIFATPFSGCCIFFCVSGYALLTYLHTNTRAINRSTIITYSTRRIIRLCPPYFIVLIVTFLFLTMTSYTPVGTNQFFVQPRSLVVSLFASLALCHDLIFGTFPRLFPPGWFIETQFQFYLIGPVIWFFYLKMPVGRIRLSIGLLLLVTCSVVASLATEYGPKDIEYSIIVFLPYFWLGGFVADLRLGARDDRLSRALRRYWPIGWCGLAALIILGTPLDSVFLQLAARIACLTVILYTALTERTSLQRALADRWLIRIGTACYSIYLVHLQVLQIMTQIIVKFSGHASIVPVIVACAIGGVSAAMAASALFYWLIERPCVAATRMVSVSRQVAIPQS